MRAWTYTYTKSLSLSAINLTQCLLHTEDAEFPIKPTSRKVCGHTLWINYMFQLLTFQRHTKFPFQELQAADFCGGEWQPFTRLPCVTSLNNRTWIFTAMKTSKSIFIASSKWFCKKNCWKKCQFSHKCIMINYNQFGNEGASTVIWWRTPLHR